jgi:hypothetical protein
MLIAIARLKTGRNRAAQRITKLINRLNGAVWARGYANAVAVAPCMVNDRTAVYKGYCFLGAGCDAFA